MPDSKEIISDKLVARCCIAGGGPAGMMLGFLLARAGVDVIVLEKHQDFLRDFRGDTIHPSTLEIMHELGLLEEFLRLPHQKLHELTAQIGSSKLTLADFTHLPTRCGFIAFMPQWDFLDFLADHARRYPSFRLLMGTEVVDIVEGQQRVIGVRAKTPQGMCDVRADLIVGADGRQSIVREKAGLPVQEFGAPMDVLWFRLSRTPDDPAQTMGRFDLGRIFVTINRDKYWQCGYVIPKGQFDELRKQGLECFREQVGINLAIQDAVAAANVLAAPLRERRVTIDELRRIQKRREFPTRVTQGLQVTIQKRVIARVLGGATAVRPPLLLRLIAAIPNLRRIPARLIGIGIRPEHIRTPEIPEQVP